MQFPAFLSFPRIPVVAVWLPPPPVAAVEGHFSLQSIPAAAGPPQQIAARHVHWSGAVDANGTVVAVVDIGEGIGQNNEKAQAGGREGKQMANYAEEGAEIWLIN